MGRTAAQTRAAAGWKQPFDCMAAPGVLFHVLYRSVLCVIICRNLLPHSTVFVPFSERWITYFHSRIEVDDRTEAYLRVLQQKVTSDTQIVSSYLMWRQLTWNQSS